MFCTVLNRRGEIEGIVSIFDSSGRSYRVVLMEIWWEGGSPWFSW